ncbi:hypothetical protein FCV25MIE_21028 [Fagus crenata]
MKSKNFQGTASKSTKGSKAIGKTVIEGLSDKQVSVELDPLEFPSLCESEEEEMVKVEIYRVCMFEQDSWQILFPKSIKKEEQQSFHELLSFWRSKELERRGIEDFNNITGRINIGIANFMS